MQSVCRWHTGPALPYPSRVLVIDDEAVVQKLLSTILTGHGFSVEVARDGDEGVRQMTARRPDLILLDLMMPKLDGWGVLALRRELPDPPPVILLSAYADDPRTAERAKQEGAWACVGKPFDFQSLLSLCDRALRGEPPPS